MRVLTIALTLLFALSWAAFAQESAVNAGVNAGVLLGGFKETRGDDEKLSSGALGYYVAGGAALGDLPISLNASYSTFSPDKLEIDGSETADDHTVSTLDLLVGYRVHENVAIAAGWASTSFSKVTSPSATVESRSASGLAVGAVGGAHLADGITVNGKVYFVPSATVETNEVEEDESGNLLGFSAGIAYKFTPNLGAEAGYRLARAAFKDGSETTAFSVSGFYAGVVFTF